MEPVNAPANPSPRETLQGDRLCMQCMHPLAGRAIEREPATGLHFVRCGECGTASALFDYPTAAPWLARMKMVVASTLVVFVILAGIVLAGAAGGFSAAVAAATSEEAGNELASAYSRSGAAPKDDKATTFSGWGTADDAWLETADGRAALAAARWSKGAAFLLLGIGALGTALATPPAVFLAIALMRLGVVRRAALVVLPALLGSVFAGLYLHSYNRIFGGIGPGMNWRAVASVQHAWFYSTLACAWFTAWCAVLALVSPSIAALLARLVVPPRDRRLVAWIWEWRGKAVPRD
ncbi:MAG: hypothetical protein RL325_1593 [Planctomycetota bacterium]|jgi:hypothetical protein